MGGTAVVEGCRLENDDSAANAFRFKNPDEVGGGAGIYVYYNSAAGTYRQNVITGFRTGIFVKTLEPGGPFRIAHNTIVDDPESRPRTDTSYGIYFARAAHYGRPNAIIQDNILTGFTRPFDDDSGLTGIGATIDRNLFWSPQSPIATGLALQIASRGFGQSNVVGDPKFAHPEQGDFRLRPGSPAGTMPGNAAPAGAVGRVPASENLAPHLSVTSDSGAVLPAVIVNMPTALTMRLTPSMERPILSTRITLVDESRHQVVSDQTSPFTARVTVDIPVMVGPYSVAVSVQAQGGRWSNVVSLRVVRRLAFVAAGEIAHLRANDHGFVAFVGRGPQPYQTLQYRRAGETQWTNSFNTVAYSSTLGVPYDDGKDVGLKPVVASGLELHTRYEFRVLSWGAGTDTWSRVYQVTTAGPPRAVFVSPDGVDAWDNGGRASPVRTLQFAIDGSLAGDRIVLLPGVVLRIGRHGS